MAHGGFVSHSSTKSSGLLWVKEILIPDTHICGGLDPRNQDWIGHIRNMSKCSEPLLVKWILEAGIWLFQDKATKEAIPYSQLNNIVHPSCLSVLFLAHSYTYYVDRNTLMHTYIIWGFHWIIQTQLLLPSIQGYLKSLGTLAYLKIVSSWYFP